MIEDILAILPARSGSKRVPGKNTRPLNGKPLFMYTYDAAIQVFSKPHICVTTDDQRLLELLEEAGYAAPFVRSKQLSSDTASSNDVIEHAIAHYKSKGLSFKYLMLLQPTSPFRTAMHIRKAVEAFQENSETQMLVSVCKSRSNPYFTQRILNSDGYLEPILDQSFSRSQDIPNVFDLNGAIYLISVEAFRKCGLTGVPTTLPYVMDEISSIDIDYEIDFKIAEAIASSGLVESFSSNES